jgi:RecB family exonuclease
VEEIEDPEDALVISPLDRGLLVHKILELFMKQVPKRAQPEDPWSTDERALLLETARQQCDEVESAGIVGRPVLWKTERAKIFRDLERFLDADTELRQHFRVVPHETEFAFGLPGSDVPAIEYSLDPDDVVIRFRGKIDRIDRGPEGQLLVLDYKTGSTWGYGDLDRDPVKRGELLQLPVYALAARQRYLEHAIDAYYWFVSEKGGFRRIGYRVSPAEFTRFGEALRTIRDGVMAGKFPARPGPFGKGGYENCRFCPYMPVCPKDKGRAWQRLRTTPDLEEYVRLAEPQEEA